MMEPSLVGATVASDVRQRTGRTVNAPNAPQLKAIFEKRWNADRGFGFLRTDDGRRVFCHVNELCSHLKPSRGNAPDLNAKVYVSQILRDNQGFRAIKVKCADCATPAVWELQPTGSAVFGVRELRPVCTNKPDEPEYKSAIKFDEVYEANEAFREAQAKERRWQGALTPAFFEEFGEPEQISAVGEKIILTYTHGNKTVTATEAYESGHWKTAPTGQRKQDGKTIYAEFAFDGIPGAKVRRYVGNANHPLKLTADFELLPTEVQTEILGILRAAVRPAESIAEERWNAILKSEYNRKNLDKLRQEMISLQAPGEMYHGQGTYKAQEEVTGHYGDETWGTGSYMDITRTYWYLVTGARKKERAGWSGDYAGGTKFTIPEPGKEQSTEHIRDEQLARKQEELKNILKEAREVAPIPAEPRLYDLTPEEWLGKFNQRIDELELALESAWKTEDETTLTSMRNKWKEYDRLADELRQVRAELEAVQKRASKSGISLYDSDASAWKEIGSDTADELAQNIAELRQYLPKAEKMIETELQAREERKKAEEAERKAEAEKRREEAALRLAEAGAHVQTDSSHEIDPKELEYAEIGTSLAKAAEEKLGAYSAIELLDGELNAGYGRARRQQAVSERLGTPTDDNLRKFYSYSKARDVDSVLQAALNYLQNATPKAQAVTPTEAAKPVKTSAPAKTTPAKPASMGDLMGRFGRKSR